MPKFTPSKALGKSSTGLMQLGLGMLVVGIVIFVAFRMQKYVMERFTSGPLVTFYKMKTCPHCVAFESEWESFASNAPAYGISTQTIDSDDERTAKAGVKGFPTIKVTVDGKDVTYEGDRTASALTKFVTELKA